jgi:bifunctional enzyme CysN/CysC
MRASIENPPRDPQALAPDALGRSPNVRWHEAAMTRAERWRAIGGAGATVWLTGLSGAGKSTIGRAVEQTLLLAGRPAYLLDGDNLRCGLNGDLGFDAAARAENVRRTAHVAALLADSGVIALVSVISPFAADRELAASLHRADGLPFIEAHVSAPVSLCEARDPKGLYARAHAGEIEGMTGVDSPYETPKRPDLVLDTADRTVEQAAQLIVDELCLRGLISCD